jgi:hypothetical protein
MDGFKNTTKTSYDTTSGRKFASGGMTVSRNDMPGGEGPMNKPAMVAKYAKGGKAKGVAPVRGGAVMGAAPVRGTPMYSTTYNPNATIGDQSLGTAGSRIADRGLKGTGPLRAKKLYPDFDVIPNMPNMGGMKKGGAVKMAKGGTFNEKGKRATLAEMEAEDRRMAGRASEGVSSRPTDSSGRRASNADLGMVTTAKKTMKKAIGGGVDAKLSKAIGNAKAAMTAAPRAKSTLVDMLPKNSPQKPSSGNPLMGGMNRGDIVASKPTPVRGPSMAPAHSNRPMIRRKTGGLAVMPKGKC